MKRYDSFSLCLCLLMGMMASGQGSAAAAPEPTDIAGMQMERDRRDMEREQVREQIAEDEAARKNAVEQGKSSSTEVADTELRFELKRVEWNPSEILTQEEIQGITDGYIGRPITAQDLVEMTDKITELYRQKGYMTCGAVLNRRIHDGVAAIRLIEGRTERLSVSGNNYTKEGYITGRLGLKTGEIANIDKLNRNLRWFHGTNDLQLRVVIKPGSKEGTTDYEIIAFEPQNQTVTLYADNDGYETSGRWREGVFYTVRSLSGQRDALRGSFIRSQGTKAWAFGYSFPISRQGMRLDLNYSGNRTKVTSGELKPLGVQGKAESYSLTLRVPFQITKLSRHEAGLQYVYQTAKTDVDWLEVSPSSGDGGRNAIAILTKQPNRTKQERTAQVVIESDGKQQVVLITQGNEYALFEKPLYEVPDTGGIVDLDFVTNIEKGKLLMSYYQLDWIEMPEKKSESRQEEEWSGKVKTITVLPNHSPVERRAPFILGIYDDSKRLLGLDTTWIRQLPGTDLE